jgi:putative peptidoglycan lipid II flippase
MAVGIARGFRFIPAVAPALPSIIGVVYLVSNRDPSIVTTFYALGIGAACEAGVLAFAAFRYARFSTQESSKMAATSAWTAVQFAALTAIAPLERIVASVHGQAGAADYNYAIRSLGIAEQLLVGGLVLAALGDWSRLATTLGDSRFNVALWRAIGAAAVALVLAGSVAAVSAHALVALVYEHGQFTARDTNQVAHLLLLALPGFVAEGASLVFAQALLAARRNRTAVAIGFGNFSLRAIAIFALGIPFGVAGVAIAYSVATTLNLIPLVIAVAKLSAPGQERRAILGRQMIVAAGTAATAIVIGSLAPFGAVMRVAALVTVFVFFIVSFFNASLKPALATPWRDA